MSQNSRLLRTLAKPAVVGGIAALGSALLMDGQDVVSTVLGETRAFIPLAIGVAGASYIAEIAKNYIVPQDTTSQVTASLAKPALTGAAAVGTMYIITGGYAPSIPRVALLGAGSEVAGDYAYSNFVSPYLA